VNTPELAAAHLCVVHLKAVVQPRQLAAFCVGGQRDGGGDLAHGRDGVGAQGLAAAAFSVQMV